jgi:predicted Zn-dependent protease
VTQAHATAAEETVARALKEGATDAEAYVCTLTAVTIEKMGALVYAREARETGIALRVIMGKRVANANLSGSLERAVPKVVDEAIRRARAKPESTRLPVFPDKESLEAPTRVDPRLFEPDPEALTADVNAISSVLEAGKDVTFHATSLWNFAHEFGVANSRGVSAWDADAIQIVQTDTRVTKAGTARTARETAYSHKPAREAIDIERLAADALARATLAATGSKPLPGPVDEVVLASVPAGELLSMWTPSIAGPANGKTAHPRAQDVGARIASDAVTLTDQPRAAIGGPRHQRMDDEGTPARDRTLVERGELKMRMFNATSAAEHGTSPTGHAFRPLVSRWGGSAVTGPGNLHLAPGTRSLDDLVARIEGKCVLVTDQLKGVFAANRTQGHFSFVAPIALYVERGEVQHALPTLTLAGDIHDVLEQIVEVGSQPRATFFGHIPPYRARGIACAT